MPGDGTRLDQQPEVFIRKNERRGLATCRCRGADALIALDCLVNSDLELGQHLQPSRCVAGFRIPNLEVLEKRIRCARDEVSEQRFHAVDDGGNRWRVPGVLRAANRHVHRRRVGDGPV